MDGLVQTQLRETGLTGLAGVQEALRDTAIIRGLTAVVHLREAVPTAEVTAVLREAVVVLIEQVRPEVQHIRGLPHLPEALDTEV